MNDTDAPAQCPLHDNIDRRKSAPIAIANTQPDNGAHWVRRARTARTVLRSPNALQAGAGAESLPEMSVDETPVIFLDGRDHSRKRMMTQRFLSPKAVSERHYAVMHQVTDEILARFKKDKKAKLEDLSFELAVAVVSEILGLTNSDPAKRVRRIERVLGSTLNQDKSKLTVRIRRAFHALMFFTLDVKPAMKARRQSPKEDAISFYLEQKYSNLAIMTECLTYATAGMVTTREFIVMAGWYLFEDEDLRRRYLDSDQDGQLAILLEILRLEPVAAMLHRRVHEEVADDNGETLPAGELYGIDIRSANVDEEVVGECPFAVDPERAARQKDNGRFFSFGDGPHNCPGWRVALHETRIFLDQLFRLPGLKLEREPDMGWNAGVKGYELRNAWISCQASQ